MFPCDFQVREVRGFIDELRFSDTEFDINRAIEIANCAREQNDLQLAARVLGSLEGLPKCDHNAFCGRIREQREKIEAGDTSRIEDCTQSGLPPIWIRGWNFAGSMAKWTASGFKVNTPETTAQRLAICQGCEHLVNDACSKCGCPCTGEGVIDKLTIATEQCPEGKW